MSVKMRYNTKNTEYEKYEWEDDLTDDDDLTDEDNILLGSRQPNLRLGMQTKSQEILNAVNQLNAAEAEQLRAKQQKEICNRIKAQIEKNANYELVQEETCEDGSIVITINV